MSIVLRAASTATASELLLRPWRDSDIDALLAAYRDPVLRRWTRRPLTTVDDARAFVRRSRQGWAAGRRFSFAVREPTSGGGRLVGHVPHQVDNPASCRVAEKSGYVFTELLLARPPFPRDGRRHVRSRP